MLLNHVSVGTSNVKLAVEFYDKVFATLGIKRAHYIEDVAAAYGDNFEFWVGPISKFAVIRMIIHQFKNLKLKICMDFTQEFEFFVQILIPSVLRNFVFETSEAPLSSILKN